MRLTMYLLRDGSTLDASALRSSSAPRELTMNAVDGVKALSFLVEGEPKEPSWISNVEVIARVREHVSDSTSYGAVLLMERKERVFALTFGTGFHAVDPKAIEPGFGLRVVANLVASSRIRGAQTRGVASNTRDQRTLLPADGNFADLDIQVDEDWLRQLSGKPEQVSVATNLAGSDSLRLTIADFSLRNIAAKLDEVLAAYAKEDFRAKFPFLDQLAPLPSTDPRIGKLDELVQSRFRDRDDSLTFAAPDPFDRNEDLFDHYEITLGYQGRYVLGDLDSASVFGALLDLPPDKDPLNDVRVEALSEDGGHTDKVRPLKSYVLAEQDFEDESFLLTAGQWFLVRHDFVALVNEQVARIPDLSEDLDLPTWDVAALRSRLQGTKETAEGLYNRDLAANRGYALLDKELAYLGPHEKLEVSDLVTPSGELLCVKAASKSAALSHLVAQAVNSAATWGSEAHQTVLQTAWKETTGDASAELKRDDAIFVLAIATPKPGPLHESLFFFTKVLLANALRSITSAQIRVALARIPMDVPPAEKKPRKKRGSTGPSFK